MVNLKKIIIRRKTLFIIFLLFNFLGLTLHFFPNLKTPLHSDLTWFYRMQTTKDSSLRWAIPVGMRQIGAYPKNFSDSCRDWWQYSARFNCADVLGQRLTAKVAGERADVWRLVNIVLLSTTMGLFYLLLRLLKVANLLAVLVSLGLFFQPIGIWTDYKSAEPRAIFFLILGFLLLLVSNKIWSSYLSALAILVAALTKETFVLAWVLVPAFIWLREPKMEMSRLIAALLPHLAATGLLAAFYLSLRLFYPVWTSGYVFSNQTGGVGGDYLLFNLLRMAPAYFKDRWLVIILAALFLIGVGAKWQEAWRATAKIFQKTRLRFLILAIVLAIFLAAVPYFLTGREILDRYQVPGNLYFSLAVAVLLTPLYQIAAKSARVWYKLTFGLAILIFILGQIRFILARSWQDRIDQQAWQGLVEDVFRFAPKDGHVVLTFDDPYMVETAYSLEANTLILGRRDLTYHLKIEGGGDYEADGFVRANIELFNKDRKEIPKEESGRVLYVVADRKGGVDYKPYLNWQISL